MIHLTILVSILIATGLSVLEYITEGYISSFPAVTAILLMIPIRQMTILTRDVDRISKKMTMIQRCLQVKAKTPEKFCEDKTTLRAKRNS